MKATSRERARLREHQPHGWRLSNRNLVDQSGMVFVECPCGWFGWLREDFWIRSNEPK